MKARFARSAALTSRAHRASTVGLFLSLFTAGTPTPLARQRKACTGDVYRLCPGEIPNAADAQYLRVERRFREVFNLVRKESWDAMPSFGINPQSGSSSGPV